ncbi:MAG TPA: vWA domain-containing protein, partial [Sphingomicrobium sp.]|nr:vWA domain-containing protein [Sphingomicrobium sp.]
MSSTDPTAPASGDAATALPTDLPAPDPAAPAATSPDASASGSLLEPLPSDPAAATPGVAEVAASPQAPQSREKTKGVADIVFVVDISGSMAPCIDALRQNIETFVGSLSSGDANNAAPVKDWRAKVV